MCKSTSGDVFDAMANRKFLIKRKSDHMPTRSFLLYSNTVILEEWKLFM